MDPVPPIIKILLLPISSSDEMNLSSEYMWLCSKSFPEVPYHATAIYGENTKMKREKDRNGSQRSKLQAITRATQPKAA